MKFMLCIDEITRYYPMRVLRERELKLICNLENEISHPLSMDLYNPCAWQWLLTHSINKLGERSIQSYLHRPKFELYVVEEDPDELRNLAGDPVYAGVLKTHEGQPKAFQKNTTDPWGRSWKKYTPALKVFRQRCNGKSF